MRSCVIPRLRGFLFSKAHAGLLGILTIGLSPHVFAQTGQEQAAQVASCEKLLSWIDTDAVAGVNYSVEEHSLSELYELAGEHPDMLLNAFQRYARVILAEKWENGSPYIEVLEPTYRVRKVKMWKAFSGLPEIKGRMIVDQYTAVDEIVQWILANAGGQKSGQMKLIDGPPGTGKTELLYILDLLDAHLASYNAKFAKYALKWKPAIKDIPELRNALIVQKGTKEGEDRVTLVNPGLENAPILGLFPSAMQQRLVAAGEKEIMGEIGFRPQPKAVLDPINKQILDLAVEHEMRAQGIRDSSAMTQGKYLEILEKYISIYRYIPRADKDSGIIRYVGETPNMGNLFMDENLITSQFYANTPLAWKYGAIPRRTGKGLFVDEVKRDPEEFQNSMLDVIQNGTASYGGSSVFQGDWVILGATNTESVLKQSQNSLTGANASNDRSDTVNMRGPIHPMQAAKIAMLMLGTENFWMKDLSSPDSKWEQADANKVFTHPDEKGKILGPDGRYALKYSPQGADDPRAAAIAPRALALMGLITAATRIVTDQKILEKHKAELAKATWESQYVTDAEKRMQVILGDLSVDGPVAKELDRIRDLFEEGTEGVTARNTEAWLKAAIIAGAERFKTEPTVTPNVVLASFYKSLDRKKLKPTGSQSKMDWVLVARQMTKTFLKEWLARDLRMIQSGDPTRVEKLYADVAQDVQTLSSHLFDNKGEDTTGDEVKIDWKRYRDIAQIYQDQNYGQPLVPAKVANEHLTAKTNGTMWEPLRRAVETYIIEVELKLASTTGLEDYFSGRQNLPPETLELGQRAERIMANFGYNRPAVRDALAQLKKITREENGGNNLR